jgi:hypothetical protein
MEDQGTLKLSLFLCGTLAFIVLLLILAAVPRH